MKETVGNSHYQEKVTCLVEFVLPFLSMLSQEDNKAEVFP